jgi:glycosyltransferase involved in cell wall biosynthesis
MRFIKMKINNKTLWIINEYAGSPYHGMEFRHYYLGKELVKRGYNVYIITASYSHLFYNKPKVKDDFTIENIDGINYVWVKVPQYKSSHDKKRVLKWFIFTFKVYFNLPTDKLSKPDYILNSSPSLFPIISGYKWAKKFNAKLLFEVRDIWPLTLIEIGGYSQNHPFIKLMEWFEKFAYKKADKVISVLPLAWKHMEQQGMDRNKFVYIPNGIDPEDYNINEPLPKEIEEKIPNDKFIVAYTGTIGKANALEYLIDTAYKLKEYKDIIFLIIGKGMEENNLKNKARDLGLDNVIFLPPVKKTQVQSVLNSIDVCYIGWERKNIYNYGISANKIFDYMYSAKPILHSYSGEGDLIKEANCGISVDAENPDAIANGILKLYNLSQEERSKLGENGKNYVLKNHTYKHIANRFEEFLK